MVNSESRFDQLIDEALAQSFSGWDFSFVAGRISELDPSWNYRNLVENRIPHTTALVDLCTGGGEFLDSFEQLPAVTFATEGFPPNVEVARQRLEQRGVTVISVNSDDALPLQGDCFDLVINRHGAYSPDEVRRIAQSGAVFLTQQVGSENATDINDALHVPVTTFPNWRLETAAEDLVARGFSITRSEEEFPLMSFHDIGALVFYLKAIPWQVPTFNVPEFRKQLLTLHKQIETDGPFEARTHRFLIEARVA